MGTVDVNRDKSIFMKAARYFACELVVRMSDTDSFHPLTVGKGSYQPLECLEATITGASSLRRGGGIGRHAVLRGQWE